MRKTDHLPLALNCFCLPEGLVVIPVGVSLSGAEIEGVRGWRCGLGALSETMHFDVDTPVISDLSKGINIQKSGTPHHRNRVVWLWRTDLERGVWQSPPCSGSVGLLEFRFVLRREVCCKNATPDLILDQAGGARSERSHVWK